jgi:hypothetical protein
MTHRENVLRKLGLPKNTQLPLPMLARFTGIPLEALQQVYNRGIGAWKTNPQSVRLQKDFSKNANISKYPRSARLSKEQWAYARVYSFLDKGKTYHTADSDIAREYGRKGGLRNVHREEYPPPERAPEVDIEQVLDILDLIAEGTHPATEAEQRLICDYVYESFTNEVNASLLPALGEDETLEERIEYMKGSPITHYAGFLFNVLVDL